MLIALGVVASAQELDPALQARLAAESSLIEFVTKPKRLVLLPSFPGEAALRADHAGIRAHELLEGLFRLPPGAPSPDGEAVLRIMRDAESLSGLSYRERGKGSVPLFRKVVFTVPPAADSLSYEVRIDDADFGSVRFRIVLSSGDGCYRLRMVNLDPLRFLFLPAVSPGKALIDLAYFPSSRLLYTAWSVRAVIFVPGVVDIELPLRRRAVALRDWFTERK